MDAVDAARFSGASLAGIDRQKENTQRRSGAFHQFRISSIAVSDLLCTARFWMLSSKQVYDTRKKGEV